MKRLKALTFRFPLLFSVLILALTMIITEIPLNALLERICGLQTSYYLSVTLEQAVCAALVAIYIARSGILQHTGMVKA